jgi:RNA polymerase sigma-70 factor (ECF subfamily)
LLGLPTTGSEQDLIRRLRAGDEEAFAELVRRYHRLMLRVASGYVQSDAVAGEVVQEAWLAVVRGIDRFEGRSSLKTWLLRIVANRAMTRGAREARSVPFSSLEGDDDEPAVSPERFHGDGEPLAGMWATPPEAWPEERLLSGEVRDLVAKAIEELPGLQRTVISLRDVEGWSSDEVRVREVVELVTEYLEGSLRGRERRRFERHIGHCSHCLRYVDQIKLTTRLEQLTREEEAEIPPGLLELFRNATREADR